MTKTYEDAILDAINIIKTFTNSGVYTIPALYVEKQLVELLVEYTSENT